jgi:hypothetical protein
LGMDDRANDDHRDDRDDAQRLNEDVFHGYFSFQIQSVEGFPSSLATPHSILFQVLSGLNLFMAPASFSVTFPKSFSQTTPSWFTIRLGTKLLNWRPGTESTVGDNTKS